MNKFLVIWLSFLVASCGLLDFNAEEKADIYAKTTLDAIHAVQRSAKNLYDTDSIDVDDYAEVLIATDRLTDLVGRLELVSDSVGGASIIVDCVEISLDGIKSSACDRSSVSKILIELREHLQ